MTNNQILDSLPSMEVYKQNLKKLEEANFNGFSLDEIKAAYARYAIILPKFPEIIQQAESFNISKLYRVRRNINTSKEDITSIEPFKHPKTDYCKSNGRANLSGTSVFYCSEDFATGILEAKPEENDIFYVGTWIGNSNEPVKTIPLLNEVVQFEDGHLKLRSLLPSISPQISPSGLDITEHVKALSEFTQQLFKKESPPYYLSSIIADHFIYRLQYDRILYQSTESNSFCNYAVNPKIIDDGKLILKQVVKIKAITLSTSQLTYRPEEIGEFSNGLGAWRKMTDKEIKEVVSTINKQTELTNQIIDFTK